MGWDLKYEHLGSDVDIEDSSRNAVGFALVSISRIVDHGAAANLPVSGVYQFEVYMSTTTITQTATTTTTT